MEPLSPEAQAAVAHWWNCSDVIRKNWTLTMCMKAVQVALAAEAAAADRGAARFVNVGATVMRGSESIATCRTANMAKRIAAALNWYKPGPRGS